MTGPPNPAADADAAVCPRCGGPATSRFCGGCGALLEPRAPAAPVAAEATSAGLADDAHDRLVQDPQDAAPGAASGGPSWRVVVGVPLLAAAVVLALLPLRPPPPEVVTPGSEPHLGLGGTRVTSSVAVTDLTPRWTADGASSPVFDGGWLGGAERLGDTVFAWVDGAIVAFDAEDGRRRWWLPALRWQRVAGVVPSRDAVELLAGDELITLDPVTMLIDGRVQLERPVGGDQLAAAVGEDLVVSSAPVAGYDRATGEVRWELDDAGWLQAVAGHLGVVSSGDGQRVVDLRDGRLRWSVPPAGGHWQDTIVLDDVLVVAGAELVAHDLATGGERWRVDDRPSASERHDVQSSGGVVLTRVPPGGDDVGPPRWSAWRSDGSEVPVPDAVVTADTLAYLDGRWFATRGDELVAWERGRVSWRRSGRSDWLVPVDGTLLVGDGRREVLALDAATGEIRTRFPAATTGHLPHTVVDGCLVTVSQRLDGHRLADGAPCWDPGHDPISRTPPWGLVPGDGLVVGVGAHLRATGIDGTERWSASPREREFHPIDERWGALVDTRTLYGDGATAGAVTLLDLRSGEEGAVLDVAGVPRRWVARDGLVAVQLFDPEDAHGGHLELWELPTGESGPVRRWSRPFPPADVGLMVTEDGVLALGSSAVTELALRDGAVRRRVPLEVRTGRQRALAGDVLVADAGPDRLVGLDARDGHVRWELALPGRLVGAPTVAGDLAYVVVAPDQLVAVEVASGEVVAAVETADDVLGSILVAGERVLVATRGGIEAFGPELPAAVSSPAGRPGR